MADSTNTRTRNNKNDARELYLSVEPEQYERHHSKIAIIMGHFALRHLNMIYQEFEGDLIMPMVFGEIAHHNILKFYSRNWSIPRPRSDYQDKPQLETAACTL